MRVTVIVDNHEGLVRLEAARSDLSFILQALQSLGADVQFSKIGLDDSGFAKQLARVLHKNTEGVTAIVQRVAAQPPVPPWKS